MTVTVLVLSVDEAHRLEHCLPAAAAQPGAEVVVIDNACTDQSAAVAKAHGARVVALPERLSYAAALNAGLRATGPDEAVLLLNADCVLDAGFLAAALPRLRATGVGSVAPRLLRARGLAADERLEEIDAAGLVVDRRRKNTLVGHGAPASAYARPGEAFGADGAAALYRRDTLEDCAVAGEVLDEDMALWASDVDLAWRARLLGWTCAYEPGALAWHVRTYSPSTRGDVSAADRRLQFRNRYLMSAKNDTWRDRLADAPPIALYEVLALGHALLRERTLLAGYGEARRLRAGARRRGRAVQSRRRVRRVPFGLTPER
ncbi:MAG: glycosyltransferase family 2 protein [Solirubrobacteraceae bacterium]